MENMPKSKIEMHTLLLCTDVPFLGVTRNVLNHLHVTPKLVNTSAAALATIPTHEFDVVIVVIVDWREIDNLAEFLSAVRHSKLNQDCVLVAIVRDLLDLKQAFAAGVHLLIHKPASAVQIERCLRTAYSATVARRRKHHREPVAILASVSTRTEPFGEATVVNLSEGGAKLRTSAQACRIPKECSISPARSCGRQQTLAQFGFVTFRSPRRLRCSNGSRNVSSGRFRGCASGSGKPAHRLSLPQMAQRNTEQDKRPAFGGPFQIGRYGY
jgi:CheY-like chemotaxis protein